VDLAGRHPAGEKRREHALLGEAEPVDDGGCGFPSHQQVISSSQPALLQTEAASNVDRR
jgi:hypothetical protein